MLTVNPNSSSALVTLEASGDIDLINQGAFELTVCSQLDSAPVLVDLHRVRFFAISALSSLVVCHRHGMQRGHDVVFEAPPPTLARMLQISGLQDTLSVRVPEAVQISSRRPSR